MKYILTCLNIECNMHNVELDPGRYSLKFDKTCGRMMPVADSVRLCYACGSKLQFIQKDGEIADFSVSTFRGQPDEKKKEILKQRYQKGMRATGNDEVEQRKRTNIAKFLGKTD